MRVETLVGGSLIDECLHDIATCLFAWDPLRRPRPTRLRDVMRDIMSTPISTTGIGREGRGDPIKNRFGQSVGVNAGKGFDFSVRINNATIPENMLRVNDNITTVFAFPI